MAIQNKLMEIQKLWVHVNKEAENPFFKSKYVKLDTIINKYNKIFNEVWIVCYHYCSDWNVITVLEDIEDQSNIQSAFPIDASEPQKVWSAITYGKRYNLWCLLNIVADKDDDWEATAIWFDDEMFEKLQQKSEKYTDAKHAISRIEKKYRINEEYKQKIENLYSWNDLVEIEKDIESIL